MQGGAGKKKHGRYEDYVDLGAGYDETDPFIDNTDAVSENFSPVEVGRHLVKSCERFKRHVRSRFGVQYLQWFRMSMVLGCPCICHIIKKGKAVPFTYINP